MDEATIAGLVCLALIGFGWVTYKLVVSSEMKDFKMFPTEEYKTTYVQPNKEDVKYMPVVKPAEPVKPSVNLVKMKPEDEEDDISI